VLLVIVIAGCVLNGIFMGCSLELYAFLRTIQDYSILQITLGFAPLLLCMFIPPFFANRLRNTVDEHIQITAGFLLMMTGTLALSFLRYDTPYVWILLFMISLTLGYSMASMHLTNAFMSIIPADLAGTAAALDSSYTQVGNAVGPTALSISLLWFGSNIYNSDSTFSFHQMQEDLAQLSHLILEAVKQSPPPLLESVQQWGMDYREAYSQALGNSLLACAGICLLMALLVWFGLKRVDLVPAERAEK
jgi:MFS family permease